jgi:hypothetical protein
VNWIRAARAKNKRNGGSGIRRISSGSLGKTYLATTLTGFFLKKKDALISGISPVLFQIGPQRREKLQRSLKLMFIFLEVFRDSFVTAVESASQSSPGTRANLHKVEAAEEGLLLGGSAEYTDS